MNPSEQQPQKPPSNVGKIFNLPALKPPPHWTGDRANLTVRMQQVTVDECVAARRMAQPGASFNVQRFIYELIIRSIVQLGPKPNPEYREVEGVVKSLGARVFDTWGQAAQKLNSGGDSHVDELMATARVAGEDTEFTLVRPGPLWGSRPEKDKTFRWRDPTVGEIIDGADDDMTGLENYPQDLIGLLADGQFRRLMKRIVAVGGAELSDEDKARWLRDAGVQSFMAIVAMSGLRGQVEAKERASFLDAVTDDGT